MPDSRHHRGPHPDDVRLFDAARLPVLRRATEDLSWLRGRGYAPTAALKLVGDKFQLAARARTAVQRAAATDEAVATRGAAVRPIRGARVLVDGFNVLVTVEAALSRAVVLRCRDGRLRDLSSVHGSYRRVEETAEALDRLVAALSDAAEVGWLLDRPVSNSGRVAAMLRERGQEVELFDSADPHLVRDGWLPATSDGPVMDVAKGSVDVVASAIADIDAWVVDLG